MNAERQVRGRFFVTTAPRPDALEKDGFCCFGAVVSGMNVVDRLEQCDELRSVRMLRSK